MTRRAAMAWRTVIALLLAAPLAWHLVALTFSAQRRTSDPASAYAWAPQSAAAAVALAQQRLDAGDAHQAGRLARAALVDSPLAATAYRVLGQIALQRGDRATAESRFQMAVQLDPRDAATQAWLAEADLRAGRLQAALWHLDALLRVHPELAPRLNPQLMALARLPQARAAYTAVFAAHPPWAGPFFRWACAQPVAADPAVGVLFSALLRVKGAVDAADWAAYLDRLVAQHAWGAAYAAWVESLPVAQQRHLDNIFDGDFQEVPTDRGFDWRIGSVPGVEIATGPLADGPGTALRLHFLGQRVPLWGQVAQLLQLAPGRYRIGGRVRLEDLENDRGLQWVLSCAGSGTVLGTSARLHGSAPWRPFAFEAVVPTAGTGCGAQWLSLHLAYRIPAESWTRGRAAFTGLRADRLRPSSAPAERDARLHPARSRR